MALKFKAPFGPGISLRVKQGRRLQKINRSILPKGLTLKVLPSGNLGVVRVKKGPSVKTPRRTSRGISF